MSAPRRTRYYVVFGLFLVFLVISLLIVLSAPSGDGRSVLTLGEISGTAEPQPPLPRIDPRSQARDLLPPSPMIRTGPPYLGDDLAKVPEVLFEAEPEQERSEEEATLQMAVTFAAALHLDGREEDGFLKSLRRERRDLDGLPFRMGKDCRTGGQPMNAFTLAAEVLHSGAIDDPTLVLPDRLTEGEVARRGYIQAARQIVDAEAIPTRLSGVKSLSALDGPEATRELARLAVFVPEREVRDAALAALRTRTGPDTADVIRTGLRYPWPAIAQRAAEAAVALKHTDLLPQLVALLDEPDPRGPRMVEEAGKRTQFAREMVRINHLKSCLLCHAPAQRPAPPEDQRTRRDRRVGGQLLANIPISSEEAGRGRLYYEPTSTLLVRIDVTYLRQDFSITEPIVDVDPRSQMQRFDFLVRERTLSSAEANELRERLAKLGPSPYHLAAVKALRALTGRDFGTDAAAWRRHLRLPARGG